MTNIHTSSRNDCYRTPRWILDVSNRFCEITFDPCPDPNEPNWAGPSVPGLDGLAIPWGTGHAFVNPPYSQLRKRKWIEKVEYERQSCHVTMLVAARTDTKWFQRAMDTCDALCFLRGRLQFIDGLTGKPPEDKNGRPTKAQFPSALIYWGRAAEAWSEIWKEHGKVY